MEKKVLSIQSPLYGRATSLMRLQPLAFGTLGELFRVGHLPNESQHMLFVVVFLLIWHCSLTLQVSYEGLRDHCLKPGSILLSDAALLLNERLNEPFVYSSVLAAIASGFHV